MKSKRSNTPWTDVQSPSSKKVFFNRPVMTTIGRLRDRLPGLDLLPVGLRSV
jgi:hypothetical protein